MDSHPLLSYDVDAAAAWDLEWLGLNTSAINN